MDIADINRVAGRKRMNVEAEKLREKVSRETAKIIKLKVAQDTAYWDLKEKLHQVENNHEKLQQNMVEVQMQHEAISGQYQDELRLRPETLNKVHSTREICDVLEEYSERLKQTVSRCKADQATLCEAYQKSGQFVKEVQLKQARANDSHRATVASLEEKIKLTSEHQSQLVSLFNSSKQQYELQLQQTRQQLAAAHAQLDEMRLANGEMARDLDQLRGAVAAKDVSITSLQCDMKRVLLECSAQCDEMNNTIQRQDKELKESTESVEALKRALDNQEGFTKSLCAQNNALEEKVSTLEEEGVKLYDEIADLQNKLKELTIAKDSLASDMAGLAEAKNSLENDLKEKDELLNNASNEIERLLAQVTSLEEEKVSLTKVLANTNEESNAKSVTIEELRKSREDCEAKIEELEKGLLETRKTSEDKMKQLEATIETKSDENQSKGETITKLMNEIRMLMEQRSKLETSVEKGKKEMELERERAKEKERRLAKQVEQLQDIAKEKEEKLSKQMSILMETRAEKEKLQQKISEMQSIIDNIQKELTGRPATRDPQPQPEQDDNAVTLSPTLMKKSNNVQPKSSQKEAEFAVPRRERNNDIDNMVFSIFSDSSVDDGDCALDPVEINRRFEAISRGERPPPVPLSSLKRRRPTTAQGGFKLQPTVAPTDSPISLSQLRDENKQKERFFKIKRAENKMKKFRKSLNHDVKE